MAQLSDQKNKQLLEWLDTLDDCDFALLKEETLDGEETYRFYKRMFNGKRFIWQATGYTGLDADKQLEQAYAIKRGQLARDSAARKEKSDAKYYKRR